MNPNLFNENHKKIILQYDKVYLLLQRFLNKHSRFIEMEKTENLYAYTKHIMNIPENHLKKRLKPQGRIGGLVFVGINPSENSNLTDVWEDPYGKYFKKCLDEAGIDNSKAWITNLFKEPTKNNRPLSPDEISSGKLELFYEINRVSPTLIVAMGKQVMEIFEAKLYEITDWKQHSVCGSYHPSYVSRMGESIRSEFIKNLIKIKKYESKRLR